MRGRCSVLKQVKIQLAAGGKTTTICTRVVCVIWLIDSIRPQFVCCLYDFNLLSRKFLVKVAKCFEFYFQSLPIKRNVKQNNYLKHSQSLSLSLLEVLLQCALIVEAFDVRAAAHKFAIDKDTRHCACASQFA